MRPPLAAIALALCVGAVARADTPDPFAWLEEVHGARALAWVAQQDRHTEAVLDGDARYPGMRQTALALFEATDRLPKPTFRNPATVDDVWQDAAHTHGLWRTASVASLRRGHPDWRVLLDLDALSGAAHGNLYSKGNDCLPPAGTRCLVSLSDGGGDAVRVREFDAATATFVPGGFDLSPQIQMVDWIDADTVVAARDWSGVGRDVSRSGYPLEIRLLRRGAAPARAPRLFRGEVGDAVLQPTVLRDAAGHMRALIAVRAITFLDSEFSLLRAGAAPLRLALPPKSNLQGLVDGQVVVSLGEAWRGFPAGAVVSLPLDDLERSGDATPVAVFVPGPGQAIDDPEDGGVATTAHRVLVGELDNVAGVVASFAFRDGHWTGTDLRLPAGETLRIASADATSDAALVTSQGFLDPTALWVVDAATGRTDKAMTLPARFDAEREVVEQRHARSADGTSIPYFVVHRRDMKRDGSTPTLMVGYGGFQIPLVPTYRPEVGRLWLEHGDTYVVANIRGGGEFGPAWHEAALREHRQRAFDDFAAIARDLEATGYTSPRHLGIYGASNGGILMSVSMVQHPELYGAVVIGNPLIDMLRYTHLPPGALWISEYGDPDKPADRAFIAKYSAYQTARPGVRYPEPLITTDTADDRVNPAHARKFAAKLESFGDPVLFEENDRGGHTDDADPEILATRWARFYTYLTQKLAN